MPKTFLPITKTYTFTITAVPQKHKLFCQEIYGLLFANRLRKDVLEVFTVKPKEMKACHICGEMVDVNNPDTTRAMNMGHCFPDTCTVNEKNMV